MPTKVFQEYCSKQILIKITPSMYNGLIEEANRRGVKKSALARELILVGLSKRRAASLREKALKFLNLKPQEILAENIRDNTFVFVTKHGKKLKVGLEEMKREFFE